MRQQPAHSRRSFIKTGLLFAPSAPCLAANVIFGDRPFRFGATPQTIAGLKYWLHPYSGIYADTAMTTLCGPGDLAAVWRDANGFSNFVQSNSAKQPTFRANLVNGYPGLEFGLTTATEIVATHVAQAQIFSLHMVWVLTGSPANPNFIIGGTAGPDFAQLAVNFTNNQPYLFAGTPINSGLVGQPAVFYYWTAYFNGAASNFYANGVYTSGPVGNIGSAGVANTHIGASGNTGQMKIAEVALYQPGISGANQAILENYFHQKYRL